MVGKPSPSIKKAYRFSIAPMMDCTDKHFRVLMRQISRRAMLYTEMIVAKALKYNKSNESLLDFDEIEHPIALQIGGDDPKILSEAAKLGEEWGYDEINLNVGCPSSKVKSGNFGACLMAHPEKVAECIETIKEKSNIPVTIKHRIGIDNLDSDEFLQNFVETVARAGADRFAIHARKALLKGLNPKQNRTIPPLQYEKVALLKKKLPDLVIELNGGIETPEECLKVLKVFDGAMVGRAAYKHPLRWKNIDELIFGEKSQEITPSQVIRGIIPYTEKHLKQGGRLWDIARHLINLVEGVKGSKKWRNNLSLNAQNGTSDLNILESAAKELEDIGL